MRRITVAAVVTALAIGAACSDRSPLAPVETTPVEEHGIVVSNAQVNLASGSSVTFPPGAATRSLSVGAGALAFVSAVPGTFPSAEEASIRNHTRSSAARVVPIVDGGIDPVGIEAAEADELSLTLRLTGSAATPMMVKVPRRRSPGVVRTNPSRGRSDVAMNVLVDVVFSEPIDASSVTTASIALGQNGNAVRGRVQLSADGLTAEFIPDDPLQPLTTYVLTITGIHDMDGDSLGEPVTVDFTTAATPVETAGIIAITSATTTTAPAELDPNGYTVNIGGIPVRHIDVNGSVSLQNMPVGAHVISLSDVSGNCVVADGVLRNVQVVAGTTSSVAFHVACSPLPSFTGRLAFVSERDGNSEIYAVNADGSDLVRLTSNSATDFDPAWSPDGRRIAFASNRDSVPGVMGSNIYVMDADGSNVGRLTLGYNAGPSWSPDGSKIAFSSVRNGWNGIYVMSVDNPTSLTNVGHASGYHWDPAWSPDGSKIAFTSDWRAYDFVFDLYVAKTDGSGITLLMEGPFPSNDGLRFYFQPAWSPDGQRIAVVVCTYAWDNCYPNSTIAVANADGSGGKPLVQTGGFARPAWSPDGSVIAFAGRGCRGCVGSLQYIWVASGQSAVISSNGHSPSWRP